MMIVPNCSISKQNAQFFCIHSKCTTHAFICKHCQNEQCATIHEHNDKIEILPWKKISGKLTNIISKQFQIQKDLLNKLQKTIKDFKADLQQLMKIYTKRKNELHKHVKYNKQFEEILHKIEQKKFDMVKGKDMNLFYTLIKENKYFLNQIQIKNISRQDDQNLIKILNQMKTHLKNYTFPNSPSNWQIQDIEKLRKYNTQITLENKLVHFQRGKLYQKYKQYDNALENYNQAIKYNSKNPQLYNHLGKIYSKKYNSQQAINYYNKAIQYNNKYSQAYCNRGKVFEIKKEFQKAIMDYNYAIEYDHKNSQAYSNRQRLYQSPSILEFALKQYTKMIQLNKSSKLAYKNRAQVYRLLKKVKQAEADEIKLAELEKKI